MHLVNDEDFVLALLRLETHLLHERPDMLDAVVGGGVEFHDVERGVVFGGEAVVANAARLAGFG